MNIVEEFGLDIDNFEWDDLALCANIPTQAYYEDADQYEAIDKAVRSLCDVCPVKEMCRIKAIENKDYGIHAGEKFERGKVVD